MPRSITHGDTLYQPEHTVKGCVCVDIVLVFLLTSDYPNNRRGKQWNNGLKLGATVAVRHSLRIVVARTCVRLVTNEILIPDVIGNIPNKNRKEEKR